MRINAPSYNRTTVQPYNRTTVKPYNRTTVQPYLKDLFNTYSESFLQAASALAHPAVQLRDDEFPFRVEVSRDHKLEACIIASSQEGKR